MFTLTNAQASAFNSPILSKLFADQNRQFPIEDAFKISDMIQLILARMEPYRTQVKQVIERNGGQVDENGFVSYPEEQNAMNAAQDMERLNAIENEYPGELVTPSPGWPNLTLAEATILRPLLNGKKR